VLSCIGILGKGISEFRNRKLWLMVPGEWFFQGQSRLQGVFSEEGYRIQKGYCI